MSSNFASAEISDNDFNFVSDAGFCYHEQIEMEGARFLNYAKSDIDIVTTNYYKYNTKVENFFNN